LTTSKGEMLEWRRLAVFEQLHVFRKEKE